MLSAWWLSATPTVEAKEVNYSSLTFGSTPRHADRICCQANNALSGLLNQADVDSGALRWQRIVVNDPNDRNDT